MTVGELIAHLSIHDPERRVVVSGYESGYSDPEIGLARILPNADPGPYSGPHEEIFYEIGDERCPPGTIEVVALERVAGWN